MPRLDGLDLSTWNGKLDAKGAAAAGLVFVACQAGWTSRSDSQGNPRTQNRMVADSWYRRNMDALRVDAPNVKRIHYYVPVNRPWREQMDAFYQITGPILAGETSMFDLEYEAARQMGWPAIRDWMDAVEQRDQRRVFHYGEIFDQDDYPDRPKWPAHYGANPATEAQRAGMFTRYQGVQGLTVWQYTSKLILPYVADGTANVDGNEILDRARFDGAFGGDMAEVWLNGTNPKFPPLRKVLEAAGQKCVELAGYNYLTESRQSDGQGFPAPGPYGLVFHHTASSLASAASDHRYLAIGHQYHPVSNVCLGMRNGEAVWGLVAAGASNTNGAGGPFRSSVGLVPKDEGNHYLMAIEVSIDGQGETWPKKLTDAAIAGIAAIAKAYHFKASDVLAHGEWAPTRKVDPAGPTEDKTLGVSTGAASLWNMAPFRARIAAAMNPTPPDQPEDVMTPAQEAKLDALTVKVNALAGEVATVKALTNDVFFHYSPNSNIADSEAGTSKGYWIGYKALYEALPEVEATLDGLAAGVASLTLKCDTLAAKVDALTGGGVPVVFPKYGPLPADPT